MNNLKFRARLTRPDGTPWLFYQEDQYLISFLRKVTSLIKYPSDRVDFYGEARGVHESHLDQPLENYLDQWTGLKDKTGKEIYNGDIIRIHNYSTSWKRGEPATDWRIFKVWWNRTTWSFTNEYITTPLTDYDTRTLEPWDIEVLGSVHTTPELIP